MWKPLLATTLLGCLAAVGCDWESADRPPTDPGPAERGTPIDPQPGNPLDREDGGKKPTSD